MAKSSLEAVYPETKIQLCIVHMVCNSLHFVLWKDYKAVTVDLKAVYQASTEAVTLSALAQFSENKKHNIFPTDDSVFKVI